MAPRHEEHVADMATDTDTSTKSTDTDDKATDADKAKGNGDAGTDTTTKDADATTDPDPVKEAEKWKALARKHENANQRLTTELETIKASTMSDQEKAIEKAKAEGRAEARAEALADMVETSVEAIAATKLADPAFASLLTDDDRAGFVTKDGKVDRKAIETALEALVKKHPQITPQGKTRALAGGGHTTTSGFSMNDEIRRRAGR